MKDINNLTLNNSEEQQDQNKNIDGKTPRPNIYVPGTPRRKSIPNRPNELLNLWSILKNCLGQDLTKIPIPVNFSEPLSMLQRLTEDYEYSYLLDNASKCDDSCEQLCWVAAFTVSSYAGVRTAKPFNPLLGETYECDRVDERGWKCISEQVSHHPPTAALYCEGRSWTCWQDFTMSSKFRGNSLEIVPLGMAHLTFKESGNHYTWRKVSTVVHNLILGKLWIEQVGEMIITNHTTGDTCNLKYLPAGYFKHSNEIIGAVANSEGVVKFNLVGAWDKQLVKVPAIENHKKILSRRSSRQDINDNGEIIWKAKESTPGSEAYYHFSNFACELNEMEPNVAPTDSRFRPDQRLMEEGHWDQANVEKLRLEEKQRDARRKQQENITELNEPKPTWFEESFDNLTGTKMFKYTGKYWECKGNGNWLSCPKIF